MIDPRDPYPQDDPDLPPASRSVDRAANLVFAALMLAWWFAAWAIFHH